MTNTNSFLAACSNPTGSLFPVMLTANGGDSATAQTTELSAQTIFRTAVTLSQGSFYNNGGTGSAQTTPFRVDGVNGNQTLSLASSVGRVTDTTHSDSITAAQKVNWNRPNQFSTTYQLTSFSMQCNATTPLAMARNYAPGGTTYTNGTRYLPLGGSDIVGVATENQKQQIIRGASTFKNLSTTVLTSTSGTATVGLRKNTADGNQTISISGTGIQSDTTHTDSVASGDLANYKVVDNSATGTFNQISVEMAGTTSAHGLFGSAATATAAAGTWFIGFGLIGFNATLGMSTEAPQQHLVKYSTSISKIRAQFGTGSGGVNGGTLTSRKNTAAGNQTVSVGATSGTIYEDTTHTDSLVSGDLFNAATTGASSLALDDLAINIDDGSSGGASTETGTAVLTFGGFSFVGGTGSRVESGGARLTFGGIAISGSGGRKETGTGTLTFGGIALTGAGGRNETGAGTLAFGGISFHITGRASHTGAAALHFGALKIVAVGSGLSAPQPNQVPAASAPRPPSVDPLTWNVPISNPDGTPTAEFQRKWQQQKGANSAITPQAYVDQQDAANLDVSKQYTVAYGASVLVQAKAYSDAHVAPLPTCTVATLPATPTIGQMVLVTDATAPTYLGALTGGGTVSTPAVYTAAGWVAF